MKHVSQPTSKNLFSLHDPTGTAFGQVIAQTDMKKEIYYHDFTHFPGSVIPRMPITLQKQDDTSFVIHSLPVGQPMATYTGQPMTYTTEQRMVYGRQPMTVYRAAPAAQMAQLAPVTRSTLHRINSVSLFQHLHRQIGLNDPPLGAGPSL